jgi:hypothetical protein
LPVAAAGAQRPTNQIEKDLRPRRFAALAPLEHKWTDCTIWLGEPASAEPILAIPSHPQLITPQGLAIIFGKIEAISAFLQVGSGKYRESRACWIQPSVMRFSGFG